MLENTKKKVEARMWERISDMSKKKAAKYSRLGDVRRREEWTRLANQSAMLANR